MQRDFLFGKKRIQLCGENELVETISLKWKKYALSTKEFCFDAEIRIQERPLDEDECSIDGWCAVKVGNSQQEEAQFFLNGKVAFALQSQPQEKRVTVIVDSEDKRNLRMGIQYGILTAMHEGCVGLHGVTVLCGREIVILSAPSGTGKTTLAELLEKHCDAITINGDFALLTPTEDGVIFEPTPFCGTSGRCLNHRMKIDRVVFLEQGKKNEWRELSGREGLARFLSNVFVPEWDEKMSQTIQGNVSRCISALKVNAFAFAPTKDAAEEFISHIRTYNK